MNSLGVSARCAAGLSGCAPCRLCRHGHSASIPHAFAPAALRASLASRGKPCGLSPPRTAWRPLMPPTRLRGSARPAHRRMGSALANTLRLLRQVVHMRVVLNAGGSCPSRHEGRFTDNPPGIAMELPRHVSRSAPQGAAGAFSPVVGWLTWLASGASRCSLRAGMPSRPCLLSDWGWFGPRRPCVVVNPGGGAAAPRGFMAATVQRKQFPLRCAHSSRDKFFSPPGPPLRCGRKRCSQPVPRRPDHNKDAMGANLVPP